MAKKHVFALLGGCQAHAGNQSQTLRDFKPLNPIRINVQLGNHSMQPEESEDMGIAMKKEAADLGLTLDPETLRDMCTKTPEKTWEIAELCAQKKR